MGPGESGVTARGPLRPRYLSVARRRTRIRQMEALVKGGGRGIWVWIVGERWNVLLRVSRRLTSDCFSSSADLVLAEMRGGGYGGKCTG